MELFCKTLPKAVSNSAYLAMYWSTKIRRRTNTDSFICAMW